MQKIHRIILSYILLSLFMIASSSYATFAADARELKPHVLPSPQKVMSSYGGAERKEIIEKVRVSSSVSLGGSCIERINDMVRTADQYVLLFMYRFNSPTLIQTLQSKHLNRVPVIAFLDYDQSYESSSEGSKYLNYIQRIMKSVPTSLVKLGGRSFHQKVIITKRKGEHAVVIVGSANATFEADNTHSEDMVFVQSNDVARFYMKEFERLLSMEPTSSQSTSEFPEQQVKIFHVHRAQPDKSNRVFLSELQETLNSKDQSTLINGHIGDVVYLALSTGFPNDGGAQRCLNIVNDALGSPHNEFLFLFENYISLNEALFQEKIGDNLKSKTPKLIVLDKNKHNAASLKELKKENNAVMLFEPFTGGKFHHKLIIVYPIEGPPIVLTGSFHISTNSIKRNSETIIGISSAELADEHLASILLNSGLGEQPTVWHYIFKFEDRLRKVKVGQKFQESRVLQAARISLEICRNNMGRYIDRLDRIEADLQSAATNADEQIDISKYFDHCKRQFGGESGQGKLDLIKELKGNVFSRTLNQIYLKAIFNQWKTIKRKYKDIDELPEYSKGKLNQWLEDVNLWLEVAREEGKVEKINIKDDIKFIEDIYNALNDLNDYEYTFATLSDLEDSLERFTRIK